MLERPDVKDVWKTFVYHPFVMAMGDGTLPIESFKQYLVQDYLYLVRLPSAATLLSLLTLAKVHFARANALASYKAKNIADIAAVSLSYCEVEHRLNTIRVPPSSNTSRARCPCTSTTARGSASQCLRSKRRRSTKVSPHRTGLSTRLWILNERTHTACTAYTRYVLDVGQSEDWIGLQMALAPCLLGYGAVAKQLHGDVKTRREGNTYWNWIENYVADDYVQAVKTGSGSYRPIYT